MQAYRCVVHEASSWCQGLREHVIIVCFEEATAWAGAGEYRTCRVEAASASEAVEKARGTCATQYTVEEGGNP